MHTKQILNFPIDNGPRYFPSNKFAFGTFNYTKTRCCAHDRRFHPDSDWNFGSNVMALHSLRCMNKCNPFIERETEMDYYSRELYSISTQQQFQIKWILCERRVSNAAISGSFQFVRRIRMSNKQKWNEKKHWKKWLLGFNQLMCQRPRRTIAHMHITILSAYYRLSHFNSSLSLCFFFCVIRRQHPYLHVRDFLLHELLLNSNKCQIGMAAWWWIGRTFHQLWSLTATHRMIFSFFSFEVFTRSLAVFNRHIK